MMASPANALSADLHTELVGHADRYDGIILDADALPSDPAEFSARLAYSVQVTSICKHAQGFPYLHQLLRVAICTGVAASGQEGDLAEGAHQNKGSFYSVYCISSRRGRGAIRLHMLHA